MKFSRLHFPRPTRARDYASPEASPPPSQVSLPAGRARPFAGRGSHPLDDIPNFMGSSHPFPFGPDGPGRTGNPYPRAAFGGEATPVGEIVARTAAWAKETYGGVARAA